ncbi:hypothetical protein F444_11677 [Phytophthora nicotianae P1976]|uniref:Uncharacterized protein n=1 Tax=Phytophthora nicotianae P1976 TaxID=1317066 RepID=A0A080ZZN8_PHYNI|nr:hypothetical protein F444_11677 [Phytophthora nicotianae P1976]
MSVSSSRSSTISATFTTTDSMTVNGAEGLKI